MLGLPVPVLVPRVGRPHRDPDGEERQQRRRQSEYAGTTKPRQRQGTSAKIKAKSAFTAAYIAVLVVAVAVCIIIFVFALQWFMESGPRIDITPTVPNDNTDVTEPIGRPEIRDFLAQITEISSNPRELTLFDINANTWRTLPLPDDANINNRSNNPISFTQLRVGQLIEVSYDARRDEITTVRESVRARELTDRSNLHVNMENRTISVGHEVFTFDNNTLVLNRNGEPFDLSELGRDDSVNITSYGSMAWLIQLHSSHGHIQVSNGDLIQNGVISIGNLTFPLSDITELLSIPEGPHRIVVEGSNIDTFIDNIIIEPGQTLQLDLGNLQIHMSTLHIITTPADAVIFVNDELLEEPSPVILPFGQHVIRVEREGYEPLEETVTLTAQVDSIRFDLDAVPRYATITIHTIPSGAEIFINHIPVGRSPWSQELPPGEHTIAARLPGWQDYVAFVTLEAGQNYQRVMQLAVATQPPADGSTEPTTRPLLILPPLQ